MSNETSNGKSNKESGFVRSPSYPNRSLREVIDAVRKIEGQYRSSSVDRAVAAKLMGYSSLSGPANKALAALASYGLVERAGKGEMRVTRRAQAILHPNSEKERMDNLQAAAFEPKIFQDLRERFPGFTPPTDGVEVYLNRQGFNQTAIKPATEAFLQTLSYLKEEGAIESHGLEPSDEAESDVSNGDDATIYGGAKVGDLVQWESQGALQFPTPLRVRFVSEDGQWVAVEGSETGIPMREVIVESAVAPEHQPFLNAPIFPLAQEVGQGEVEWIRNKVGQETSVRLLVKGDMGPKEIGKLIKLLEAQKLVLED